MDRNALKPPDIVLLSVDWQSRIALRAQLIEDGFDVVATDNWPMMRRHMCAGFKPRLAVIDVSNLPDAERVLEDTRVLMKPDHVLVLTALGAVAVSTLERFGFHAMHRPVTVDDIVKTVVALLH